MMLDGSVLVFHGRGAAAAAVAVLVLLGLAKK